MKKIYLAAAFLALFSQADAQVLNQSAGWPNAAWTITGSYSTDPLAFEADPTTTANFAFDDDDAGNGGHEDNIAAESPVIDLTAAFTANERSIVITVDYGYYYLADDQLQFQYWDADAAVWVAWPGANLEGNNTDVTDDFCTIPKTTYVSDALGIGGFTPTQLSGFKYRISYDDNPAGTDWNYGFCFNSPTITSVACAQPGGLAANNVTANTADISWTPIVGITGFEYVLDQDSSDPTGAGTATTDTTYPAAGLDASGVYYFHLRVNCGSSFSDWSTLEINTSAEVPENDSCATAIAIPSFPYTFSQDASAATNNDGVITVCSGMNDGVWFSFEGTGNNIVIETTDIVDWDPELGVYTGSCGAFVCVDQVDDGGTGGGESLVIPASVIGTTYYINFGHYSGSGDSPEGVYTINITEETPAEPIANDSCETAIGITSFPYTNTQDATGATNNAGPIAAGCSSDMNDGAWYTFTGTGGDVTVNLTAVDGWDPELGVYTGTCGTFTCAGSIDNGGTSGDETLTVTTVLGTLYYVNVGHYNGSEDQPEGPYTIGVDGVLATKSFSNADFRSYPNPVKDVLNVSYTKNIDEVAVYNLVGQEVFRTALNAKAGQVNLSLLNTGTYIVKLTSDNEVQSLKILKQ